MGKSEIGGRDRDRTCDLVVANDALSQLSYTPTNGDVLNFSRGVGEKPNGREWDWAGMRGGEGILGPLRGTGKGWEADLKFGHYVRRGRCAANCRLFLRQGKLDAGATVKGARLGRRPLQGIGGAGGGPAEAG